MMAQRQTVTAEQLGGDRTGRKCESDDGGGKVEGKIGSRVAALLNIMPTWRMHSGPLANLIDFI